MSNRHYRLMASNEGMNSQTAVVEVAAGQSAQLDVIAANGAASPDTAPAVTSSSTARPAAVTDPVISPSLAKELATMKARIEKLETELKNRPTAEQPPAAPQGTPAK